MPSLSRKNIFSGVLYLVVNYIGTENYMNVEQILEMHNAGWEVGSHSMNHLDLSKVNAEMARAEIVGSRKALEDMLGIPILTFAYPFGAFSKTAMNYVKVAGYQGAMGARGYASSQGKWNLYYLQRVEVSGKEDTYAFIRFLPWHGDPAFLSGAITPAP